MLYDPKWGDEPKVIQNLRELSQMLRNEQAWRGSWQWSFDVVKDSCGSAGCALGLWDHMRGEKTHMLDFKLGGPITDVNPLDHIFYGDDSTYGLLHESVTPESFFKLSCTVISTPSIRVAGPAHA